MAAVGDFNAVCVYDHAVAVAAAATNDDDNNNDVVVDDEKLTNIFHGSDFAMFSG